MFRPILAVLALSMAAPAAAQSVQSNDPPVIVAQGEASVRQAPDVAWVQIAVEARGSKPDEARQKSAEAMTSVLNTLKKIVAAEALRTATLSVQPEMEYVAGSSRVKGYVGRNQVEVRVDDLTKLDDVMDKSLGSGATSVSGLRLDVKARPKLERDALRLAVQDATERAQAIAAGANRTLGPIIRIQEQRQASSMYRVAFDGVGAGGGGGGRGGAATPVSAGEIEIRAVVTMTAAIR